MGEGGVVEEPELPREGTIQFVVHAVLQMERGLLMNLIGESPKDIVVNVIHNFDEDVDEVESGHLTASQDGFEQACLLWVEHVLVNELTLAAHFGVIIFVWL